MAPLFETLKLLHAQTSILYYDILSAPIAKTAGRLRSCYTSTKSSWRRHSSVSSSLRGREPHLRKTGN